MSGHGTITFSFESQAEFAARLQAARSVLLREARIDAVNSVSLSDIDTDLQQVAPPQALRQLAAYGVRGEVIFATPTLLRTRPTLLGYYRLLIGYSQKEFYQGHVLRFRPMETAGRIGKVSEADLVAVCTALNVATSQSLKLPVTFGENLVHELQLLTLGPQFRGSRLNKIGQNATSQVLDILRAECGGSITSSESTKLQLTNRARRRVTVAFASDPDIAVTEVVNRQSRHVLAIEIKGGKDVSNIHNRLGEAEKSHQKAKAQGYIEFWTILQARVDPAMAKRESPTTTRFFALGDLLLPMSKPRREFVAQFKARVGL
jgi:hypothetical protein